MNVPVAGLSVQKKIPAMSLELGKVKSPDAPVILDNRLHFAFTGRAWTSGKEVPHQSGVLSSTRLGQLELEENLVSLRGRAVLKGYAKLQTQAPVIRQVRGEEFQRIYGKRLPGLRFRYVFASERCKAMISAYEEIVATDVRCPIVGRPVAQSAFSVGIPDLLHLVGDFSPGGQCSLVYVGLLQLARRSLEFTLRLFLVEALAIAMIEGQVSFPDLG